LIGIDLKIVSLFFLEEERMISGRKWRIYRGIFSWKGHFLNYTYNNKNVNDACLLSGIHVNVK
jgi:hypothetical protein